MKRVSLGLMALLLLMGLVNLHSASSVTVGFSDELRRQLMSMGVGAGLAALADEVAGGEVRTLHTQNLLLADVPSDQLHHTWTVLKALRLATPMSARRRLVAAGLGLLWLQIFALARLGLALRGCTSEGASKSAGHLGRVGEYVLTGAVPKKCTCASFFVKGC